MAYLESNGSMSEAIGMRRSLHGRRSARRAVASSVALTLLLLTDTRPADAYYVHKYSVAMENTHANNYTTVAVERWDNHFNLPGNDCTADFVTPIVFQSQWANISADGQNWIEIGTGHRCE